MRENTGERGDGREWRMYIHERKAKAEAEKNGGKRTRKSEGQKKRREGGLCHIINL